MVLEDPDIHVWLSPKYTPTPMMELHTEHIRACLLFCAGTFLLPAFYPCLACHLLRQAFVSAVGLRRHKKDMQFSDLESSQHQICDCHACLKRPFHQNTLRGITSHSSSMSPYRRRNDSFSNHSISLIMFIPSNRNGKSNKKIKAIAITDRGGL
jgi:hypothetical protein